MAENKSFQHTRFNRRKFLEYAGITGASTLIAACAPAPIPPQDTLGQDIPCAPASAPTPENPKMQVDLYASLPQERVKNVHLLDVNAEAVTYLNSLGRVVPFSGDTMSRAQYDLYRIEDLTDALIEEYRGGIVTRDVDASTRSVTVKVANHEGASEECTIGWSKDEAGLAQLTQSYSRMANTGTGLDDKAPSETLAAQLTQTWYDILYGENSGTREFIEYAKTVYQNYLDDRVSARGVNLYENGTSVAVLDSRAGNKVTFSAYTFK